MRQAKPEAAPPQYKPPASPESEQALLGSLLIRPDVMEEVVDLIEVNDFYTEAHGRIYMAMLGLYNSEQPIDLVSVSLRLKEVGMLESVGGPVFLAALSEAVGFSSNFAYYTKVVKEKALLRRMLDTTQQIAGACFQSIPDVPKFLDESEEKVLSVRESQKDRTEAFSLETVLPDEVRRIEGVFERKVEIVGVPSGFRDLDAITGGWQLADLIIVAARPSMGKTALGLNMGVHAADKMDIPTLFFSMEQPKEQLAQRLLAAKGLIDATRLRSAKMWPDEWVQLNEACTELMDKKLFIVDKPALNTLEIRATAKRMMKRHGIGLIVLDYLQLAREKARSREQEVGGISRSLKALAKELKVPVIALAQLNRDVEKRPNKRPMLSDLRESGSIEQDADVIMFIYRDEVYKGDDSKEKGTAEVRVAKQRNGPTGKVKLAFRKEYQRFEDLARQEELGY
jgi:replicative DNA helicase